MLGGALLSGVVTTNWSRLHRPGRRGARFPAGSPTRGYASITTPPPPRIRVPSMPLHVVELSTPLHVVELSIHADPRCCRVPSTGGALPRSGNFWGSFDRVLCRRLGNTPSFPSRQLLTHQRLLGIARLVAYTFPTAVVAGQYRCPQGMACVCPRYSAFLRTSAPPGDDVGSPFPEGIVMLSMPEFQWPKVYGGWHAAPL